MTPDDDVPDLNFTSHTYNEGLAEQLYARLPPYQEALSQLLERLRQLW